MHSDIDICDSPQVTRAKVPLVVDAEVTLAEQSTRSDSVPAHPYTSNTGGNVVLETSSALALPIEYCYKYNITRYLV